jgi:predicted nucleic acid-binding protein
MRSVVLDTNLLVLLVVGSTEPSLIQRHKRTKGFDDSDYRLLTEVLCAYDQLIVTPHILAETSNLLAQAPDDATRGNVMRIFEKLICSAEMDERFDEARMLARRPEFHRLGLTDCAALEVSKNGVPFITTDVGAYLAAAAVNHNASNFNHWRSGTS